MRIRRRPRELEPVRLQLGTLTVDHRVKHEYTPRPKPDYVTLFVQDKHGGRIGTFVAQYPGQSVEIPAWMLGHDESPGRPPVIVQVQW